MSGMDPISWQANVEELLALQSILQTGLVCFVEGSERLIDDATAEQLLQQGCCSRGLSCNASIHPCMPDAGIIVEVKPLSIVDGADGRAVPAQQTPTAARSRIQHLSPINLEIAFPKTYPMHNPPGVHVSAEWLSSEQGKALKQQLLALWHAQGPGGPICFIWTDWVQNDALSFLGIVDTLLLTFDPHASAPAHGRSSSPSHDSSAQHAQLANGSPGPHSGGSSSTSTEDGALQEDGVATLSPHLMKCSVLKGSSSEQAMRRPGDSQERQAFPAESAQAHSQETQAHSSANQPLNGVQPARGKHRNRGRRRPSMPLDPSASAWQPGSTAGAMPMLVSPSALKQPTAVNQPSLQGARHGQSQQSTESQRAVHAGSSSKRVDQEQRRERASAVASRKDRAESGAGSSSTRERIQQHASGSDMERVAELYMDLVAYSKQRERALFQEGHHACGICMEDLSGSSFVWPGGCSHAYCRDCLKQLCSLHVAEGGLDNLRCPQPDCKQPFLRQNLVGLLAEEQLARWEDLELAQGLQRMTDCVFCPRCSSACLEDAENCAQCPKCFFVFCSLCNESWHPGIECMSAETKLKLLRQRMLGMTESVAELRRREMEYMSLVRIQETSKRCPSCGMAIEKSEGCNKMTCGNCGAFFCWRCNKAVDGYEHFRSGSCILFDHGEIQRWELEFQMQIERAQAQARNAFWGAVGERRRSRACPSCGQMNHKKGDNNHMRCWACTAHFCYLCRQTLRGSKGASGSHFGKLVGSGKCRQHNAD